jgi:orotate phosphoribosyltransferase
MDEFRHDFIQFAISHQALCFGNFKTKAGRITPYFFNSGKISDGKSLRELASFYAKAINAAGVEFDMLFGSAYKGIPLATALSMCFAASDRAVPFSFNRKETKDHGEGGELIGATPKGSVLIVDDVISAGTSVRHSVRLIRSYGANPCALAVALDRMEKGIGQLSAVEQVKAEFGIPVISVVTLRDLIAFLEAGSEYYPHLEAIRRYREQYGAAPNAL